MFTHRPESARLRIQSIPRARVSNLILAVLLGAALLLVLLFALAHPVRAAGFVVTNTHDSGPGSLRQAILDANGSAGADTITFNLSGCPCSISLLSTLNITGALTIQGLGASELALDGGHTVQIIKTGSVPVSISDITIRNGNALTGTSTGSGGGIFAVGPLSLNQVTVDGNTASAGSGGGIYASNLLTLTQVTIEGNTARDYGGGVLGSSKAIVTGSTFENNTAVRYDGGGLYVSGALQLSGSQFNHNRTMTHKGYGGGGGVIAFGPSIIDHTAFISNTSSDWGGGAYLASFPSGTVTQLTSVQFTGNEAEQGGGGGLFSWFTTTLNTVDFIDNTSSYRGGGVYGGYAGNYRFVINGGLIQGNSASGGGGLYSDGDYAMDATQVLSNTSRSGNGGGAWTPMNATISNATISYNTVITQGNSGGIDTGGSLTLTNSTLSDNRALGGSGGGSGSGGDATIINSHYIHNTAANLGGGLLSYTSVHVRGSSFTGNRAKANWGGGFYASQTSAITNTVFVNNQSEYAGGAVGVQYGSLQVTGGRFERNTTTSGGWGGAIYAGGPDLTIQGTHFFTNTSQAYGGAVVGNNTGITDTVFSGNTTDGSGGALTAFKPSHITNSQFMDNRSTGDGGAILAGDTLGLDQSLFQANISLAHGGAINAYNTLALNRDLFVANQAVMGGAVSDIGGGTIANSLFARNHATSLSGEALALNPSSTLSLLHTTIVSPTLVGGSAIYVIGGTVEVKNSIVATHTIGILVTGGTVSADYNLFHGNVLDTQGAGVVNNHPVAGNPAFFQPAQDDYHLGAGSVAVNAGPNVGVSDDIDGDVRPQGSGFDLGYDEAVAPEGLSASSNSPTPLGSSTAFTASVSFGRAVTYQWDFGDGATGSGSSVTHTYAAAGVYHVTVTAANGAGSLEATLTVTVNAAPSSKLYLPLLER